MKTAILYTLLVAGQSADIATTCAGLRTGRYEEAVLPVKSCIGIAAVKGGLTGASMVAFATLRRRHPKWAVGLILVPAASGFVAAGLNIRVMLGSAQ